LAAVADENFFGKMPQKYCPAAALNRKVCFFGRGRGRKLFRQNASKVLSRRGFESEKCAFLAADADENFFGEIASKVLSRRGFESEKCVFFWPRTRTKTFSEKMP